MMKKTWAQKLAAAVLAGAMLFGTMVPSALAAGKPTAGNGKPEGSFATTAESTVESTRPKEEIARSERSREDVTEYAPLLSRPVKAAAVEPKAGTYTFDPDNPFVQEETFIPTYGYVPCTGGYVLKIDMDKEEIVASYRGSSSGRGGPRRVAYDQNGNAWIGNLSDAGASILSIKAEVDGYSAGSTSVTSNPTGALAFAAEKATQEYALPGANGVGGMVDVRCIAFDREGHLWVGPSSGNFIREYEIIPQGTGENQTFDLKVRRTVVVAPDYAGAYVVAFNNKGDLYISEIGNRRVFVVKLANHDELYPYEDIAEADRVKGDPRMQNLSQVVVAPAAVSSIYAVANDMYTGDIWASGYTDGGKVYRISPDYDVTTYNTSVSTASLGARNTRTGIEFDKDYVYINGHASQVTLRLNRKYTKDADAMVKNADVWNLALASLSSPHGLFPYEGKLFLISPNDNKVAVLDTNAVPANTSGTPKVHTPVLHNITAAGTPYVYGAFATKKLPPGATVRGKSFLMEDGELNWTSAQSAREGARYRINRIGKAPWHTEGPDALMYEAKVDASGNMLFWEAGALEASAAPSAYLEQGNYTITEVTSKTDEYIIMAGVNEGNHQDDRSDTKTLKFSVKDKGNIRLDYAYAAPKITVDFIPPGPPIPQNYPLPTRVTVYSPTGLPSKITIKRDGQSDMDFDVKKDPARNIAYVDIKDSDINILSGSNAVAVVPNPNGGTMEVTLGVTMERIDMLNPIITKPADGSVLDATSITIKDADATNRYSKTDINDAETKFTLTPKGAGKKVESKGKDWATLYPTIPAGVYDVEIYAQDSALYKTAPNSATAVIKDAIIDNGTESPQIQIEIVYDSTAWTNEKAIGTVTIKSTLPVVEAKIDTQTISNTDPRWTATSSTPGNYTYTIRDVEFQTNTGTGLGSEDYKLLAYTVGRSYAEATSKVTWIDKLNPVIDGPAAGAKLNTIGKASFTFADLPADALNGESKVNDAKTVYTLINKTLSSQTSGPDIEALINNALGRPGAAEYLIRVRTEDNATNKAKAAAGGNGQDVPGGPDGPEIEFGPFPGGEGGGTQPGANELTFTVTGGDAALKKLSQFGGRLTVVVDKKYAGDSPTVTFEDSTNASTIVTPANVLANGRITITYPSGMAKGKGTIKITIGADSGSKDMEVK